METSIFFKKRRFQMLGRGEYQLPREVKAPMTLAKLNFILPGLRALGKGVGRRKDRYGRKK